MPLRLVIFANDGRGARNVVLRTGGLALALVIVVAALTGALWLGWKIGSLI